MTIGDEVVHFTLDPPGTDRRDGQPLGRQTSREPNLLQLKLSYYQPPPELTVSWTDSDNSPLENQLTNVAVGLIVAGEWSYRSGLVRHHECLVERQKQRAEQARQQEEERQRKQREKILKREQDWRERLFADVAAWNKAALVRSYVQAMLERPRQSASIASLTEWATWALAEADSMDPLNKSIEYPMKIPDTGGEES